MNLLPTFLQGCLLGLFIIFLGSPTALIAQVVKDTQITFELLSQESLTSSPPTLFQPPPSSSLPSAPHIERGAAPPVQPPPASVMLPYQLPHLQSEDGSTILQYGDRTSAISPNQTDFFWFDAQGNLQRKLAKQYLTHPRLGMSEDGFVCIIGLATKIAPPQLTISLFSPKGGKIWEVPFPSNRQNFLVPKVFLKGKYIIFITRDKKDWKRDHQIHIFNNQGKALPLISWPSIYQKSVFAEGGEFLFIQGNFHYGLLDLRTGKLRGMKEGKIRLMSPKSLLLYQERDTYFLLDAVMQNRRNNLLPMTIKSFSIETGNLLGEKAIPNLHHSSEKIVLKTISQNEMQITTEKEVFRYSWSSKQ